ncbi:MAG: carbohydrate kinase [Luteococcus sp.]|uniref:carbohydrate kinase family protein n=1 Tax=Luteococcus sp. TaxID=1969402 RepID=UPI00264A455B|nr:carbohydrate kinase [Luteococcus sp.]MDN5562866.1 carbohydrate kinase [Luteococcus sp.]
MNSEVPSKPSVLCLGEALVDVVIRDGVTTGEHVGGSPLNVACVMSRLGHDATIGAWWGKDERGAAIERHAADHGVPVQPGSDGAAKTPVAFAHLDAEGRATYEFDLEWALPDMTDVSRYAHLHTGSIAATLEPGGTQVVDAVTAVKPTGTTSYDPNVRPALMEAPEKVLGRIEELVALADVVKASDEDIEWLYPGIPVEDIMRRWAAMGPALVVITRGPWGAYALLGHNRDMLHVDQMTVKLADTVGAGDSFMGGLLSGLLDAGLLGSREAAARLADAGWNEVQPALHRAVVTSGLTVSRAGAHAPTREDIEAVVREDPSLAN